METSRSVGFLGHVKKGKDSFIHLLLMGGVLILSMRCVGQKYRIQDLRDQKSSLQEENNSLNNKMANLKKGLLEEAANDNNRDFFSKVQRLFGDVFSEPGVAGENKVEPSKRFGV